MNSVKWIASLLVVAFFTSSALAQQVTGIMMVVKGDIKVTTKDGKTDAAKVGKKVTGGDTITAGADSRAKIVMADKNVINVSPDSKIVIEKYENDGKDKKNVELNVVYGKVRASVEQKYDGEKSKFNVKTPSAVAGVRGTDFITGYNPSTKTASITTFSGSVAVGQPGPGGSIQNPVFVQAGQTTSAGAGKPPEPPKAVPKEDLNKMNSETSSDSASNNSKSDGREPASETKKEEKKEQKEEKKEEKKNSSNDKGSDKKDDGQKKEDPKKEEPKKDPKKEPAKSASNTTATPAGEPDRSPASTTTGSTGTTDSSSSTTAPAPTSTSTSSPAPAPTTSVALAPPPPPPPPPPPTMLLPPPPPPPMLMPPTLVTSPLITDIVKNSQFSKTTINLVLPP